MHLVVIPKDKVAKEVVDIVDVFLEGLDSDDVCFDAEVFAGWLRAALSFAVCEVKVAQVVDGVAVWAVAE